MNNAECLNCGVPCMNATYCDDCADVVYMGMVEDNLARAERRLPYGDEGEE